MSDAWNVAVVCWHNGHLNAIILFFHKTEKDPIKMANRSHGNLSLLLIDQALIE